MPGDTHDFVEKVRDTQRKAAKNRNRGEGNPGQALPGKQHSTNK